MSKLIILVKKEMEAEVKERKLREEKASIRAMLELIDRLEGQIESRKLELKEVKADLEKGEYKRVQQNITGTINNDGSVTYAGNISGITTVSQ